MAEDDVPGFDVDLLDDPPEDFPMFGRPSLELERDRALGVDSYKGLVSYQTWGFDYGITGRKTKAKYFALLRKIVYNQQPHLRAKDWQSFICCECDAGPGLLELRYNAPRVTRMYPNGIPAVNAPPPPPDTPGPRRSTRSRPSSQSSRLGSNSSSSAQQTRSQSIQAPATDNHPNNPPVDQRLPTNSRAPQTTDRNVISNPSSHSSGALHTPSNLPTAGSNSAVSMVPPLPPMDMSFNTDFGSVRGSTPSAIINQPIIFDTDSRLVVEAIEREMLRIAYQGLERHPLAFPVGVSPTLTAASAEDFSKPIGVFPGASRVRLVRDMAGLKSKLDPNGSLYSYRGRGPISTSNSSAVDCTIVAGKLLDAGSTVSDRAGDDRWASLLTPTEKAFLEATTLNWDSFSEKSSIETRDDFWKLLCSGLNHHNMAGPGPQFHFGESLSPALVWDICTASFQQFTLGYDDALVACPCRGNGNIPPTSFAVSSITPRFEENDRQGLPMGALLSRFFHRYEIRPCHVCKGPRDIISRQFSQLPLRLVVQPDPRALIYQHTSNNITFNYCDRQNQDQIGTYRWLGGVYSSPHQEGRYSVFWTDDKRGEDVTGQVCMYDGTQNSGVIVGSIPASDEERVPKEWWIGRPAPLLFYERVLNPSLGTLITARDTVEGMIHQVNDKKLILESHTPWKRSRALPAVEPPQKEYLNDSPSDFSGNSAGGTPSGECISPSLFDVTRNDISSVTPSQLHTSSHTSGSGELPSSGLGHELLMPPHTQSQPQTGSMTLTAPPPQIESLDQSLGAGSLGYTQQTPDDYTLPELDGDSLLQAQPAETFEGSNSFLGFESAPGVPQPFNELFLGDDMRPEDTPSSALDDMWQEIEPGTTPSPMTDGKRQRSSTNDFGGPAGNDVSPLAKKQRTE
ncbi:hypothetical protein FQN54_004540 [Arachnomyces sp. PD_36]|nr:hypothetical protein FQN54_004540 [Arachnomyces sp. PD_36]